jgi:hypothetical protein
MVAVLGLCGALTDAYAKDNVCSWPLSVAVSCILFHVKVEGDLTTSVLRKMATLHKKEECKTDQFLKILNFSNPATGQTSL